MVRLAALAGVLVLAACSQAETGPALAQASETAQISDTAVATHPVSGLNLIDLAVVRGDKRIPFRVELADTPQAQAKGLMFRTELGDFEGMLFPSQEPQARSFWMKNTPLSLDIIFVGVDGRISNIAADTVPYSLDSVPSDGLSIAVLELRAGRAKALGIVPGDRVEWTLPD
ncbi:DUF192 domain-containing protein [Erythrobacter sp. JK5]|uniref:DUF192 domain-containing protein n=1 Tax=Erythrobacter sp. JK5 TaxID=2829500 RepID=UPI001BA67338|nr:DUF192 domain-containing protein [Erythrobacter sp. JK5]QUL36828.1 DUF192 domain-containing protein [Erythrobacter sp. JK5]